MCSTSRIERIQNLLTECRHSITQLLLLTLVITESFRIKIVLRWKQPPLNKSFHIWNKCYPTMKMPKFKTVIFVWIEEVPCFRKQAIQFQHKLHYNSDMRWSTVYTPTNSQSRPKLVGLVQDPSPTPTCYVGHNIWFQNRRGRDLWKTMALLLSLSIVHENLWRSKLKTVLMLLPSKCNPEFMWDTAGPKNKEKEKKKIKKQTNKQTGSRSLKREKRKKRKAIVS